jgi:hypothetical protein
MMVPESEMHARSVKSAANAIDLTRLALHVYLFKHSPLSTRQTDTEPSEEEANATNIESKVKATEVVGPMLPSNVRIHWPLSTCHCRTDLS